LPVIRIRDCLEMGTIFHCLLVFCVFHPVL
jgi:hypothetical protein